MPHKHKRKRDDDFSNFDLAPSTRAKPLAPYTKASLFSSDQDSSSSNNKRRKPNAGKSKKSQDDTPKAFARMMAWQAVGKKPNGLDDGASTKSSKKRTTAGKEESSKAKNSKPKPNPDPEEKNTTTSTTTQPLKILPSESLSTFSQRVDQTLPLTSLTRTTATPINSQALPADIREALQKTSTRTTKHNRRLQRLQTDWRATKTRLQAKREEAEEDLEDQLEEDKLLWSSVKQAKSNQKGKKKLNRSKNDDDDDPWKQLDKIRREETKQKSLQDVVKAPPNLTPIKKKFKSRREDFEFWDNNDNNRNNGEEGEEVVLVDVENVPNAKGRSLRRREELNETRRQVIEGYRKMLSKGKGVRKGR